MSWMDKGEGWTRRYNSLISAINKGVDVDEINPPLEGEEREWYIKSKDDLEKENEKIKKECEELGIPVYRTGYGPVELEW